MTTCSRYGCTKTLRANNTKGVCSTNCESSDAPVFARAAGVGDAKPHKTPPANARAVEETPAEPGTAAARFRSVHDAMGMDPEKTLADFYASWLDGIRQALES